MKKNNKPVVALVASAIRPHLWMQMREYLMETNETPFVMIFCGHIEPEYELPENIVHIYCEMDAAACVEVAYRHAYTHPNIKYIMNVTDDCTLCPNMIDRPVEDMKDYGEEDIALGPGFAPGPGVEPVPLIYHNHDPNSPQLMVFALMKVSTSKKIGGIDKRFDGIYWDCDRIMRLYELGGNTRVYDDMHIEELIRTGKSLCSKYFRSDRKILNSFWTIDRIGGPCSKKRMEPVVPYEDEELVFEVRGGKK
jgi:hypothetical protein